MTPWEHFVPVKSDMSDLFEKYDWVRASPDRARAIGAAARRFWEGMTLEREWAEGARLIDGHWND